MSGMKIHFVISPDEYAQNFGQQCIEKWGQTHILQASYVVSLGGDGTALVAEQEVLSNYLLTGQILPIYNIDCSMAKEHVGALTNKKIKNPVDIEEGILDAKRHQIYPLQADCELSEPEKGKIQYTYYGFNEIAVKIRDYQMTYLDVDVVGKEQFAVRGDGLLIATPMGRNGYYNTLKGKYFSDNQLGLKTIVSKDDVNSILSQDSIVTVKVRSKYRPTCVMRDCNLISSPIVSARIYKSKIPLTILKDRQRD